MAIRIKKIESGYIVKDVCSQTQDILWKTEYAVSESELREHLRTKGFDQREIEEAFLTSDNAYFGVGRW